MEPRTRWIAISLALAAASAFALGVNSAWWSIHEAAIGPFGTRHCFGSDCKETGLSWIGGTDLWMRSSVATRAGGYIAMFVLVLLGGSLAAKRVPKLVAKATLAASATAAVSGAYFAAAFTNPGGAGIAYGMVLFFVGAMLGLAAAITVLRVSART